MTTHDLKTWPEFFSSVQDGTKTFEVRYHDRPYRVGDILKLREWLPLAREYTGQVCFRRVTYITTNSKFVLEGYCIMGLAVPSNVVNPRVVRDQVRDLIERTSGGGAEGATETVDGATEKIIELVLKSLV